jgi:hypothetical protein
MSIYEQRISYKYVYRVVQKCVDTYVDYSVSGEKDGCRYSTTRFKLNVLPPKRELQIPRSSVTETEMYLAE